MSAASEVPPDWRTGYDFLRFPRQAFAWEYLRRKDSFREACETAKWRKRTDGGPLQVVCARSTMPTEACLFTVSADEDAGAATVFWDPDACPKVLRLLALPAQTKTQPFVLADTQLPTTLLLADDGLQHVLIRDGVRALQLCVRGENLLAPVTLTFDTGMPEPLFVYQVQMLACFHACRAGHGLPERYFPPDPPAARLTFVLRALDGWLGGATQREIATVLYGHERVERDWRDPKENLRDQVRHAITRGRTLMDHGYRAFLR